MDCAARKHAEVEERHVQAPEAERVCDDEGDEWLFAKRAPFDEGSRGAGWDVGPISDDGGDVCDQHD